MRIGLNEQGYRVGEYHQHAKLTNNDVELIFQLREDGFTYSQIAVKFDVSKSCIAHIINGLRRGQQVAYFIKTAG